MTSGARPRKPALVLSAGGARAAYQVGVLRYIGKQFPDFQPKILTGVSAGSINACFLAQGQPFDIATERMYRLWQDLRFSHVLKTNFKSLARMVFRWGYDLFISKLTNRLLLQSLLDASPLATTLLEHIHFWKISRAVHSGQIAGLALTATNYHDGTSTVFFDSTDPIQPWIRENRRSVRTSIRIRHIMASCSIPILFEPIRIGDYLYGDGSLRFNMPFSPAIQLGATEILSVGIRCSSPQNPLGFRPEHVSLGFVAGVVMNSIFLDSLEADFENLMRINRIKSASGREPLPAMLVRPSQDLGFLARGFLEEVPFHLRQLLKSTANANELGDLLSYLMFSPGYINALLELGMKDAEASHAEIAQLIGSKA